MRALFFLTCLVGVIVYAWAKGGNSERYAGMALLVASLLTALVASPEAHRFTTIETGVFIVDLGLLFAFVVIVLKSDRYWPIWLAALQLIIVLAHLARLADPAMMRTGYAFLMAVWSYPQVALIAFGTWNQQRRMRRTNNS